MQASYVRSHFDAMAITVHDMPRHDEIAFVLAVTTGGHIHARSGELKASAIQGEGGLR